MSRVGAGEVGAEPPAVRQRLVVHIGPMKTGSTSLQRILAAHADELRSGGVEYPLFEDPATPNVYNQQRAIYGLFGPAVPWVTEARQHHYRASAAHLTERLAEWPGDVLLSAESLSAMAADDLTRALADLATPHARELTVIAVLRDLGRALPSQWQQDLRSGRGRDLPQFLERFRSGSDQGSRNARMMFDYAHQVERLVAAVGADRVVVVTVPPPGGAPITLWERFAAATGLPAVAAVDPGSAESLMRSNQSLTQAECETLRRLNLALHDAGADPVRTAALRYRIVREAWWVRPDRDAPVGLPVDALSWLEPISQHAGEVLAGSGVRLVGQWDDLRPQAGAHPEPPTDAALLAAHGAALTWLAAQWADPTVPSSGGPATGPRPRPATGPGPEQPSSGPRVGPARRRGLSRVLAPRRA